ncbi:MAG: tetratricopeptide repeat protein [Syntrophales bacterium]|nr:tetratricopeptide repeat protein [Syntrophales bacterium]
MMSWKKWWLVVIAFTLGTMPSAGSSEELNNRPTVGQFPAEVASTLLLPLDQKEWQVAGDKAALAALRHAKAAELRREYLQGGDMKKLYTALNTVGEAIKLDPDRSQYWVTLGNIHSELARFNILRSNEYAQDSFRQALDLAPDDATIMVLLAVNLARTGEYEEALDYFEKAVRTNILMLSADIARWMNVCYLADAHTKRGAIFYEDIQSAHPEYYYLNLYQAVLYKAHFDYDSARRELTQLLERGDADQTTKETAQKLLAELDAEGGTDS